MSGTLNLAIIGTNWITNSFVQASYESKKFQLVAVYSRSHETARKFISDVPSITDASAVKTYDNLASMLSDSSAKIDVVYIASPNSLHYEQSLKVLDAGKNVIVEKPIASNTKQLKEVLSLADSKGLFILEAFRHLQEPNFLKLQSLLHDEKTRAEKFGPIYGASMNMAAYSSRYAKVLEGEEPNVLSLNFSGGSLWDMGCYPVAFTLALFGKPSSQSYFPVIIRTGVDGGGHMILNYAAESSVHKEKFTVHAHTSKIYTSTAPSEIYCEKGTIRINGGTGVTDINTVEFVPCGKKEGEQLGNTSPEYQGFPLNLTWEAKELGRIILEGDRETEGRMRKLSTDVLTVMEDMRKQNGIVFACEK